MVTNGDGSYRIINAASGLALDAFGGEKTGNKLGLWTWHGGSNQKWVFQVA
ncbi:MAG: RICIN domain-containing protein [Coriobacteriales bacterium]|nr:RICIN domain-containing protein [Coriobacteriales bacterium]